MAVDGDSYSTVARVEAIVGDIPINESNPREFTTTSTPTIAQVELFIDNAAAELNNALAVVGYIAPIVEADDKIAYTYIRYANDCGAALQVLDTMPTESYQGMSGESIVSARRGHCQNTFLAALRLIKAEGIKASRESGATRLADFTIGSSTNSTGATNKPLFERGKSDYPGSRSLSEP